MTNPDRRFIGDESERAAAERIRMILDDYRELIMAPPDRLPDNVRRERENLIREVRTLCALSARENRIRIADSPALRGLFAMMGIDLGETAADPPPPGRPEVDPATGPASPSGDVRDATDRPEGPR